MRINNNIMAMNTHRQYGINNAGAARSVEKLSSGYRINRAGDDAAGLAISEKMRAQIRGLTMASKNSQDAISLVQTAEGALQETHNILQRMREISVQSASDTNETTIDRDALNKEFQALIAEIDDTADKTKFNDMGLIDGSFEGDKVLSGIKTTTDGVNSGATARVNANALIDAVKSAGGPLDSANITVTLTGGTAGVATKFEDETSSNLSKIALALNDNFGAKYDNKTLIVDTQDNGDGTISISIKAVNEVLGTATVAANTNIADNSDTVIDIAGVGKLTLKASSGTKTVSAVKTELDGASFDMGTGGTAGNAGTPGTGAKIQYDNDTAITLEAGQTSVTFANGVKIDFGQAIADDFSNLNAIFNTQLGSGDSTSTFKFTSEFKDGEDFVVQTGANKDDELAINIDYMDSKAIGVFGSNVASREYASNAIKETNDAINKVSTQRAALGALQNRMEHKIANLDTSAENLQSAESRIRDLDMAQEMTKFTKNNILSQASTAMLAQANSLPQGVLGLLR